MSQATNSQKVKKRKLSVPDASESSTKKPKKHSETPAKSKKDRAGKLDKGKSRATVDNEFRVVRASLSVSVPPVFAANLRAGVEEMLDSMLMRYIPVLQGVVVAHDNLEFLDPVASLRAESPFANCRIAFDATTWSPQVGMKLTGKINLCSPDHISLLLHRTFNASIPRHHIVTDSYEFEYGPAENDPQYGADAVGEDVQPGDTEEHVEGAGRWVHKVTGTKLGDADGYLEFTIVGLTIANQMLSLVGSIQPDPFNPEHVPRPTITMAVPSSSKRGAASLADTAAQSEREVDDLMEEIEEVESGSDVDTFEILGRMGDEEKRKRALAEAEAEAEAAEKAKKRKRKEGKAQKEGDGSGKKSKKKKS